MKRMLMLMLLCGCVLFGRPSKAQVKPIELKMARNAVYEWIDNYNVYARCEGRNAKGNFYSLFESGDLLIFNDYLPMEEYDFQNPMISVRDYVSLVRNSDNRYLLKYELRDGKIVNEEYRSGKLLYSITMTKEVWFVEKGVNSDDRYEYPSQRFNITVALEYRIATEEMVATSFLCSQTPSSFVVLHEGIDNTRYNKVSEVELICKARSNQLVKYAYHSTDFDKKMIEISCDTLKNYVGCGYTIGEEVVRAPISDSRVSDYSIVGGLQHSTWFSCYRQLSQQIKHRWGLEIGLLYKNSSSVVNAQWIDRYPEIDPDNSPYQRIISGENYVEQISRNIVELPITARYEYLINRQFSVFAQAGISVGYSFLNSSRAVAEMDYRGYYDWLFDVTLSQNGIYDFGQFSLSNTATSLGLQKLMVGSVFSLGGCYYFQDNWMLEFAFRYRGTLWGGVNRDDDYHLSQRDGDWRSLTYLQDKYLANAFNFHLQINYNF